jgi:protein-S-isoprenylcysteine O-methyltransferase Ste14
MVLDILADEKQLRAFVFKNRGSLLALPALALAVFGRPSAFSVAIGLPIAFAGEFLRCWAVGYSGVTTRGDHVEAPKLTTAGPYSYVRNPLYIGNAITALGFGLAYTGRMAPTQRFALVAGSLGVMAAVYSTIVPHEEEYLLGRFGDTFKSYCEAVPQSIPRNTPYENAEGEYDPAVIAKAETRTFVSFGVMLLLLALKAKRADG